MFCDLADSTNLGEQLDPESLRRVISRYYEEMAHTVERHGGTTVKFIGDAVMAVFGMPVVHENDALRAVRTAAEMSPALDRLNRELEDRWGVRLDIRTGVNTGEVVVCEPGSADSAVVGEVVGDAVNVAARLEQAATAGEVLIGADTYRLVRDTVNAEAVEPLEVKGKARPVRAYRLLDVMSGEDDGARPLDLPIVGRDRELEQLKEAYERAASAERCELVTVLGPAGIGKSRLVHELSERMEDRATTLKGRCLPYGEGITFWPIAEIARDVMGIGAGKQPEEVAANVAALLPDDESASDVVRAVADATGVADTSADTQEIAWAVRRLFEALARKRPLIVVFDDVHWAEATFLNLIEDLVGNTRDVPMLVVCMARGELLELRPGWGAEIGGAATLTLEPLASADSERLIGNLLGDAELGEEARRIASTAEGNPLFLQEILRMLVDDGVLQRRGGRWRAVRELSDVAIPPTIRALLAARLDRLSQGERLMLERAAIVGLEFWPGAVAELLPEEVRREMDSHLESLAAKELIRPGGTSFDEEDALRFAHLLIRDAAYEQMLKETRAELHERFVAWLERRADARAVQFEEIIGYHLEQAYRYREELGPLGDQDAALARQAALRLAGAGRRALARGDMPAAVNLLERSVSLLPSSDPEHPDLLLKLGIALAESGEVGRADALLSERIREERRGLPFLSYRDGAGKQQIFDLDAAVSRVRIGRKPSNDIPLEWDAEVSRTHASILKVDDRWVLIDDERSRNGSFVNGQRVIDRHVLEDGDILRFGETLILYRSPVATDVLARGRMDPRSTTATATGVPTAVFLSETQRSVLLALCGLLEEGGETSGAAADEEIAKQLSLDVQAVRENLWALSHVFDTEELPGDEGVALLVERAKQTGVIGKARSTGHTHRS